MCFEIGKKSLAKKIDIEAYEDDDNIYVLFKGRMLTLKKIPNEAGECVSNMMPTITIPYSQYIGDGISDFFKTGDSNFQATC